LQYSTKTINSNVFIFKGYTETVLSDAYILKPTSKTINSDAYIKRSYSQALSSDAWLTGIARINSNAYILRTVSPGEVSPTANTKAIWHMNNGPWSGIANEIVDNSGNAHHGTAFGSTTTVAAGKIGRCGYFPSGSNYALITGDTDFNFGTTGDFSIAFWAKTLSTVSSTECMFAKLSSGNQDGYYVQVKPTVITFGTDDGGVSSEVLFQYSL
ncbi:unnamed protein product, partial [marine sediment metagenome]